MFSPINKRKPGSLLAIGFVLVSSVLLHAPIASAQNVVVPDTVNTSSAPAKPAKDKWYDKISLRGYVQIRYNRLLETNPQLKTDYDKSVGDKGGFLIRRARLVFSGDIHDRVYMYIQPDLASSPSGSPSLHFVQLRDAYFDIALDKEKEYRLRIGQSKIPYGFENMQSSQNRLTQDRNDALNSALPNERDLGLMFYWAPAHIRERFRELASRNYKGSGDYGVFGLGIYNGQTANRPEANNNQHVVARLSYPFAFQNGQIIEPGIQAYTGLYTVTSDQLSSSTIKGGDFIDRRVAASFVLYPQPFGLQAEYNVGEGPEFDPETNTIQVKPLEGGYVQAMYLINAADQTFIPFVKVQYYEGGKKAETDARHSNVYETEVGLEWQPLSAFELAAQYTISDRTTQDGRNLYNRQHGQLLRLQAQFNF
ncbi:porin [Rufibacter roseus]|uniref:Porin n=1 Tax=Rufibacter roseus TaxID=1567108 RepID=A0ABW2DIH6_9BACT|nr:porin [Rufibacter roseus]